MPSKPNEGFFGSITIYSLDDFLRLFPGYRERSHWGVPGRSFSSLAESFDHFGCSFGDNRVYLIRVRDSAIRYLVPFLMVDQRNQHLAIYYNPSF